MNIIPCKQTPILRDKIRKLAEDLKAGAYTLGDHGLSESEFYNSGLFRAAIERIRGQLSATVSDKREFVQYILDHMRDQGFLRNWELKKEPYSSEYTINLNSGNIAVLEVKGCLDGNSTNIFERPHYADEFIIWSVCTNPGANPQRNAWSGIHTRLSSEIITRKQRIDGIVFWDKVCGTIGRPCPKWMDNTERSSLVGPFKLPPTLYISSPGNRSHPAEESQAHGPKA